VGNGLDTNSTMGSLANPRRITAIEGFVQDAVAKGGKLEAGGHRVGNKGYFFEPTVISDTPKDSRAMNEEPFGPVALVAKFNSREEAIAEANRLPYGLASYAFTSSTKTATAIGAAVESGMIGINNVGLGMPENPFGGVKDSGYGSEGGIEAMEAYLNTKFISQTGM
jgi:succinate-semialdehyde dehydrogenase/glutarate-semialdehyde dehydrogenase